MVVHKIEAKNPQPNSGLPTRRLQKVAAYCRVSTEQDEQANSYEAQIEHYSAEIAKHKDWLNAGIYADKGISGTMAKKRPEFLKMIRHCRQHKIDLILVKSISRFARNTVDCLEYIRELKALGIGVIFEKENINTLTETSEAMITIMGYDYSRKLAYVGMSRPKKLLCVAMRATTYEKSNGAFDAGWEIIDLRN